MLTYVGWTTNDLRLADDQWDQLEVRGIRGGCFKEAMMCLADVSEIRGVLGS